MNSIELKLSEEQLRVVGKALNALPHWEVRVLIDEIHAQVNAHNAKVKAAAENESA